MPPRVSLPKRRAGFAKRERRRCQNAPVSCGRRAIPRNPLITKVFSKAWTMPSMRDRAVSRFFRRCARVRRRRSRIGARHRRASAFRCVVRRNNAIATPGSAHRRFSAAGSCGCISFSTDRIAERIARASATDFRLVRRDAYFFGRRRKFGLGRGRKRKNRESLANRFANDSPMEIGFTTRKFCRARLFDSFVASIACHATASDRCREVEPSPSPRVSRRRRRPSRTNSFRASKTAGPACDFRLGPRFRPSARLAIPGQAPYFPAPDGIVSSKTRHYPRSGSLPA